MAEPAAEAGTPVVVTSDGNKLVLMTLNLQYYSSYPKDEKAAEDRLREVTGGANVPDIICVQEGLACKDVLRPLGYNKLVCSGACGEEKMAQSVHDMVYGDEGTLKLCADSCHQELLVNQIYIRQGAQWEVIDRGVQRISSNLTLSGGCGRAAGVLALRSMVWVKLRFPESSGPCVYVMCTHISGGRFEDQYFVQQLAQERYDQTDRINEFFKKKAEGSSDVGILLGDFNATTEWTPTGPMCGYFKMAIKNSEGVKKDAADAKIDEEALEDNFRKYMISPFTAINEKHGWTNAYTQAQVGVTSGFGHLIDHMCLSRPIECEAEVKFLTNQKFSKGPEDTALVLTDHNSVIASFFIK